MSLEKGVVVLDPRTIQSHPSLFNALRADLGRDHNIKLVHPDLFSDSTPHFNVPGIGLGRPTALIPGFISGREAEKQLSVLTKAAHTLRYQHYGDSRTPWTAQAVLLLSDMEGRGNKPTTGKDGHFVPEAELHYAFYLADMLNASLADSIVILDPHDYDSVQALAKPVVTLSAIPEIVRVLRRKRYIPEDSGVAIADNGSIGRSHFFAHETGLPLLTRIVKQRLNGKPSVVNIYGGDNVKGMHVILVDDMVASSGTIFEDTAELMHLGATDVTAVVTHTKGVPSAWDKLTDELKNGNSHSLRRLVVTNSTPYYLELFGVPKLHVVNISPVLARAARAILNPNSEYVNAMQADLFPIAPVQQYLEDLHNEHPELAPDHQPVARR